MCTLTGMLRGFTVPTSRPVGPVSKETHERGPQDEKRTFEHGLEVFVSRHCVLGGVWRWRRVEVEAFWHPLAAR